jgi:hypothetical protein
MPFPTSTSASRMRARRAFHRCLLGGDHPEWPVQHTRQRSSPQHAASVRRTSDGKLMVTSPDGCTSFVVGPVNGGLLIDQLLQPDGGSSVRITMLFSERIAFVQWCQRETARLQHPQLFEHVRQYGHEVFDRSGH